MNNEVKSAKFLANGNKLKTEVKDGGLMISLPAAPVDANASVIKVEVKGNVSAGSGKPKEKMKAGELD